MNLNLFWPIFAHFLGDWSLQTSYMAENKGRCPMVMVSHVMVWTACMCVGLLGAGIAVPYWKVLFLASGHAIIDNLWADRSTGRPMLGWPIYVDQGLHLLQVAVCVIF
jgi:hypothetical protein